MHRFAGRPGAENIITRSAWKTVQNASADMKMDEYQSSKIVAGEGNGIITPERPFATWLVDLLSRKQLEIAHEGL